MRLPKKARSLLEGRQFTHIALAFALALCTRMTLTTGQRGPTTVDLPSLGGGRITGPPGFPGGPGGPGGPGDPFGGPGGLGGPASTPALAPLVSNRTGALLWGDEFREAALNTTRWAVEVGDGSDYGIPGWGNKERETYTANSVAVKNGYLILTAEEAGIGEDGNMTYTSGKVSTHKIMSFAVTPKLSVRIEASIKLPDGGKGMWPSFWLLPEEAAEGCYGCGVYGGWPTSGEINIMEAINDMSIPFSWLHFGGPAVNIPNVSMLGGNLESGSLGYVPPLDNGFHTFALDWTPTNMTFSVDGRAFTYGYCSQAQQDGGWYSSNPAYFPHPGKCAPFDRPFYIVLQMAVGGGWPGYPDKTTKFPQYMMVDWVRVYSLH